MGLENLLDSAAHSIGNAFTNVKNAGVDYFKSSVKYNIVDTLVTGAFGVAGAFYAYLKSPYFWPVLGGAAVGTLIGRVVTWPIDIYAKIRNLYRSGKEAVTGKEESNEHAPEKEGRKEKPNIPSGHGMPNLAPQPA